MQFYFQFGWVYLNSQFTLMWKSFRAPLPDGFNNTNQWLRSFCLLTIGWANSRNGFRAQQFSRNLENAICKQTMNFTTENEWFKRFFSYLLNWTDFPIDNVPRFAYFTLFRSQIKFKTIVSSLTFIAINTSINNKWKENIFQSIRNFHGE